MRASRPLPAATPPAPAATPSMRTVRKCAEDAMLDGMAYYFDGVDAIEDAECDAIGYRDDADADAEGDDLSDWD